MDLATVRDYEMRARQLMAPAAISGLFSGPDDYAIGKTLANNIAAFRGVSLRPRVMVDVSSRSMATEVLGQPISCPIMIDPVGGLRRFHPQGELAAARAAAQAGT